MEGKNINTRFTKGNTVDVCQTAEMWPFWIKARTPLLTLSPFGGMSGVPVWARDRPVSRGREAVSGGRISASDSLGGSGSSKRYAPGGKLESQREPKLGKTSGVFAAGAWAARMEIARLLEAGFSAETIVSEINSGQESDEPLVQGGAFSPPESMTKAIGDFENERKKERMTRESLSPGYPSDPKEKRGRSEDD